MKKALVIVLVLAMALSVVGLVSCSGTTYQGEYSYKSWGNTYGCMVDVTVQGNVITSVKIREGEMEEKGWHNLSPNWTNNPYAGAIEGEAGVDTEGKTNWRKYGQAMVDSFVGLTVEEVLGIKVYVDPNGQPLTGQSTVETIKYIPDQLAVVVGGHTVGEDVELAKDAGATQSSARVILAVQNALLQGKDNKNCVAIDIGTVGTAYGLVHRQGYVGIGTITVKFGKIAAATLNEACFPTQVKADASAGEYAVEVSGTYYWKTVKFGNVTMVYDATAGYKVGNETLKEYFAKASHCEAYAKAVMADKVAVETKDGDKTDIMTSKTLLKSNNGYWSGDLIHEGQLGWKANVDATCKYVVANGFDGFEGVVITDENKADFIKDNSATNPLLDNEFVDKNGVKTGATWTDMLDYINLLHSAYNQISK